LTVALEAMAEDLVKEHPGGATFEHGRTGVGLRERGFAQRLDLSAQALRRFHELVALGQLVDLVSLERLGARDDHAVLGLRLDEHQYAHPRAPALHPRAFAVDEVPIDAVGREGDRRVEHHRRIAERRRDLDDERLVGRRDRSEIDLDLWLDVHELLLDRKVGVVLVLELAAQLLAALHFAELGDGRVVLRLRVEPDDLLERQIHVVEADCEPGPQTVAGPVVPALGVAVVELRRADADVDVDDAVVVELPGQQGAVFCLEVQLLGRDDVVPEVVGRRIELVP